MLQWETFLHPPGLAGNQRGPAQEVVVPQLVAVPHFKTQRPERKHREDNNDHSWKAHSFMVGYVTIYANLTIIRLKIFQPVCCGGLKTSLDVFYYSESHKSIIFFYPFYINTRCKLLPI